MGKELIIPETTSEEMDELFADEKLAAWMIANGYATGHGDSTDDLLDELAWQVYENLNKRADEQVEACVASLKAALCLWLPDDRMDNIIDICRSASLTKRGK